MEEQLQILKEIRSSPRNDKNRAILDALEDNVLYTIAYFTLPKELITKEGSSWCVSEHIRLYQELVNTAFGD